MLGSDKIPLRRDQIPATIQKISKNFFRIFLIFAATLTTIFLATAPRQNFQPDDFFDPAIIIHQKKRSTQPQNFPKNFEISLHRELIQPTLNSENRELFLDKNLARYHDFILPLDTTLDPIPRPALDDPVRTQRRETFIRFAQNILLAPTKNSQKKSEKFSPRSIPSIFSDARLDDCGSFWLRFSPLCRQIFAEFLEKFPRFDRSTPDRQFLAQIHAHASPTQKSQLCAALADATLRGNFPTDTALQFSSRCPSQTRSELRKVSEFLTITRQHDQKLRTPTVPDHADLTLLKFTTLAREILHDTSPKTQEIFLEFLTRRLAHPTRSQTPQFHRDLAYRLTNRILLPKFLTKNSPDTDDLAKKIFSLNQRTPLRPSLESQVALRDLILDDSAADTRSDRDSPRALFLLTLQTSQIRTTEQILQRPTATEIRGNFLILDPANDDTLHLPTTLRLTQSDSQILVADAIFPSIPELNQLFSDQRQNLNFAQLHAQLQSNAGVFLAQLRELGLCFFDSLALNFLKISDCTPDGLTLTHPADRIDLRLADGKINSIRTTARIADSALRDFIGQPRNRGNYLTQLRKIETARRDARSRHARAQISQKLEIPDSDREITDQISKNSTEIFTLSRADQTFTGEFQVFTDQISTRTRSTQKFSGRSVSDDSRTEFRQNPTEFLQNF